jgi:hypothetical protein
MGTTIPENLKVNFWRKKGGRILNELTGVSHRFSSTQIWAPKQDLIVGWTPKAGCTVVKRHVYDFLGLRDDVEKTGKWVQFYSHLYIRKHLIIPALHWKKVKWRIKFVRNPYHRFVSSYTYAMGFPNMVSGITEDLNCNLHDISFEMFTDWVEQSQRKKGWNKIDSHIRPQYHREEERYPYNRIIHIEQMQEEMEALAREGGPKFNFTEEFRNSWHHRKRAKSDVDAVWKRSFKQIRKPEGLPDYPQFYTPELRARVAHLFQDDFEKYGYATEA